MVLLVVRYYNCLIWSRVMGLMNGRMVRAENHWKKAQERGADRDWMASGTEVTRQQGARDREVAEWTRNCKSECHRRQTASTATMPRTPWPGAQELAGGRTPTGPPFQKDHLPRCWVKPRPLNRLPVQRGGPSRNFTCSLALPSTDKQPLCLPLPRPPIALPEAEWKCSPEPPLSAKPWEGDF